jgi:hypothetical protein
MGFAATGDTGGPGATRRPIRRPAAPTGRGLGLVTGLALGLLAVASPPASAAPIAYDWQFDLTVDQVTPHDFIDSRAVGQAWIHYDAIADHLDVFVTWTDLVGEIERIHVHGPALPGFNERNHVVDVLDDPSGIPAGTGLHTGQLSVTRHLFDPGDAHGGPHGGHYTPEQALAILVSEEAYMLVHTSVYFEGEIRGQLVLTSVTAPEPGSGLLVGLGLGALAARAGRRRSAHRDDPARRG